MSVSILEAPAVEPVELEDIKRHVSQTLDDDDDLLRDKIVAARQYLERHLGLVFITQTIRATFNGFPAVRYVNRPVGFALPRAPVREIISLSYIDTAGNTAILAPFNYTISIGGDRPTFLSPGPTSLGWWPMTGAAADAVVVEFVAGFGDEPGDVPEPLREAIRRLAADMYENREASLVGVSAQELPFGVADLIAPWRTWEF